MKIPKYVQTMVENGQLCIAPISEQIATTKAEVGVYGYLFRVYIRNNAVSGNTFRSEVERLVAWAQREHAESEIHEYNWFSVKEHRKPYYKRDYALVTITDPVAQQLERLMGKAL